MRRLYILRHAKSSWADPGKSDFERELNERGLADVGKIARYLSKNDHSSEKVLCSSSHRTRMTYAGLRDHLPDFCSDVEFLETLYESPLANYLDVLQKHSGDAQSVMIIGHNPTSDALAHYLADGGDAKALQVMATKFPTGALAIIDLDIDRWDEITEKCGKLVTFTFPKAL